MLVLRDEQLKAMAQAMREELVEELVYFLMDDQHEWCRLRSADEVRTKAESIVELSAAAGIAIRSNIMKLMLWHIIPGFTLPLNGNLANILSRPDFDEDYRIEEFYTALTSARSGSLRLKDVVRGRRQSVAVVRGGGDDGGGEKKDKLGAVTGILKEVR